LNLCAAISCGRGNVLEGIGSRLRKQGGQTEKGKKVRTKKGEKKEGVGEGREGHYRGKFILERNYIRL